MDQNETLDKAIEIIRELDDGESDFVDPDGDVTEKTQSNVALVAMLTKTPIHKVYEKLVDSAQTERDLNTMDKEIQYSNVDQYGEVKPQ